MSAEFGLALALLTLGSCYASYRLGQQNILTRYKDYANRRREREARWQEFKDFEDCRVLTTRKRPRRTAIQRGQVKTTRKQ